MKWLYIDLFIRHHTNFLSTRILDPVERINATTSVAFDGATLVDDVNSKL